MANNQITPFQLTDQFTMDNFNQRINETNIALQNNDPRQWGLGTDSILLDSLDNALETGWYKSNGATPASGYWNCLTERYNSQSITQTAVQYDGYGASIARRMMSLGVFGPWEWVNPPMQLGIEYRTTERYRGKPVYVRMINAGKPPKASVKSVSYQTNGVVDDVISCTGCVSDNSGLKVTFPGGHFSSAPGTNDGLMYVYAASNGYFYIMTYADLTTWGDAYVTVKYTKIAE